MGVLQSEIWNDSGSYKMETMLLYVFIQKKKPFYSILLCNYIIVTNAYDWISPHSGQWYFEVFSKV